MSRIVLSLAIATALSGLTGGSAYYTCQQTPDCIGIDNMECVDGKCVCPPGMFLSPDNTECIKTSSYLLAECQQDIQCKRLYTGYRCDNETNTCMCNEGFRYLDGRCWPISSYGEACVTDRQCYNPLLPYSLGCIEGICDCAPGYYFRHRGYCRKIANKIGDRCILNFDCQVPGKPNVNCVNTRCVEVNSTYEVVDVPPKKIVDLDKSNKVDAVYEGDVCSSDKDCEDLPFSQCSEYRHCECKLGYYADESRQNCVGDMGKNSTQKICETLQMAVFEDGICDCPNGFFYTEYARTCIKASRTFNESCANDLSCYTFGSGGICVQSPYNPFLRICDCNTTMSFRNDAQQLCVPLEKWIFDNCTMDEECPINAGCIDDICQCTNGTQVSSDNRVCLEVGLALGSQCREGIQCSHDRLDCINNRCSCKEEYFEEDEECKTGIGFACESDKECDFPGSLCISFNNTKTCNCDENSVQGSQKCLPKVAKLGSACNETIQCADFLGGLEAVNCSANVCDCSQRYHPREESCWPIISLGELCTSTQQCYLPGNKSNRTHCRNSFCQCTWEYVRTYAPDDCSGTNTVRGGLMILLISIMAVFIMK